VIAIGLFLSSPAPGFPPLAARVQAHVTHPRLLTITDHVGLGHPLVREIGGVWVGSSCMQLLSAGAILRLNGSQLTEDERASSRASSMSSGEISWRISAMAVPKSFSSTPCC
jgi:hypothetical protein